jgi:hypothetical protein
LIFSRSFEPPKMQSSPPAVYIGLYFHMSSNDHLTADMAPRYCLQNRYTGKPELCGNFATVCIFWISATVLDAFS